MVFPEFVRVSWAQQLNKYLTYPGGVYCSLDCLNSGTQERPLQQADDIFNLTF